MTKDEITSMLLGIMFCLPAALVICYLAWKDGRNKKDDDV